MKKEIPHEADLEKYYTDNGVSQLIAERLEFWNKLFPNSQFSKQVVDIQKVGAFELRWLSERFPEDYAT